jgi:hypothetical protein
MECGRCPNTLRDRDCEGLRRQDWLGRGGVRASANRNGSRAEPDYTGDGVGYPLAEFFVRHDTELLLGKAMPMHALNGATAGRVSDRLYAVGTTKLCTACAVRLSNSRLKVGARV